VIQISYFATKTSMLADWCATGAGVSSTWKRISRG